ncbi:MAG: hypothetical protein WCR60_03410 [Patescibacteria group bacterium]|jgi:hypothetical protein
MAKSTEIQKLTTNLSTAQKTLCLTIIQAIANNASDENLKAWRMFLKKDPQLAQKILDIINQSQEL